MVRRFSRAALCIAGSGGPESNTDTGPGCGLGKELWENASNQKSIGVQVLAATTNGTSGNQTFGISSGTSGCTSNGTILAEYKVTVFASANFDNLSQDMARGNGEHLTSFAELLNIPQDNRAEFYTLAQTQYRAMIQSGENTPAAMLASLNSGMSSHPALAEISYSKLLCGFGPVTEAAISSVCIYSLAFVFGFVFLNAGPSRGQDNSQAYLQDLLRRAHSSSLHEQRYWRLLLHYRPIGSAVTKANR